MARDYGHQVNPDTGSGPSPTGPPKRFSPALLGLVNPGDEVIIGEPFYDSYLPAVQTAVSPASTSFSRPTGPLILIMGRIIQCQNQTDPHQHPPQPHGQSFYRRGNEPDRYVVHFEHYVLALVDEVYEDIMFDDHQQVTMAQLPGMWPRTLHISSLGKHSARRGGRWAGW